MGRLAGAACAGMTRSWVGVLWLAGRDPLPTRLDRPVVWLMPHGEADREALPPPSREDRADAAAAMREGGAPRLLRRRMLRALLASLFHLHPQAVRFDRDPAGAPFAPGLAACLSTAGCEGWSAVAVASGPVGVDLELAPPGEAGETQSWTLIEAYLKALGRGLFVAPGGVRVEAAAEGAALSLAVAAAEEQAGHGWLHTATPGVLAAVVLLD